MGAGQPPPPRHRAAGTLRPAPCAAAPAALALIYGLISPRKNVTRLQVPSQPGRPDSRFLGRRGIIIIGDFVSVRRWFGDWVLHGIAVRRDRFNLSVGTDCRFVVVVGACFRVKAEPASPLGGPPIPGPQRVIPGDERAFRTLEMPSTRGRSHLQSPLRLAPLWDLVAAIYPVPGTVGSLVVPPGTVRPRGLAAFVVRSPRRMPRMIWSPSLVRVIRPRVRVARLVASRIRSGRWVG